MCGIGGFWGTFDCSLLNRINRIQAHRGPDDSGTWHQAKCGFGLAQTRLSIIDLSSAGHQPMQDPDTGTMIVFNGEIYNYQEIKRKLTQDGFCFQSTSDTEVLLKLYARYGTNLLKHLNGIFAFAIWNDKTQELFLARDQLGVKPLYYAWTRKGFVFASELKALLLDDSIPRELSLEAIQNYLTYLWCPAPLTPLQNVFKLEPGQACVLQQPKDGRFWYYYDLPYSDNDHLFSLADAAEAVRETVREAVQRQMVADVKVGAFLSGGLDSSSVVAFGCQGADRANMPCFSIRSDDNDFAKEGFNEDWPYAQRAAKALGVDLDAVRVDSTMLDHLPRMLYHLDEPQADLAPLNVLFISQLARDKGIKVLLSGAGGDDIFSGYPRHRALALEKWWSWMPSRLRGLLQTVSSRLPQSAPLGRRLAKAFQYADSDPLSRLIRSFFFISPEHLNELFGLSFMNQNGQPDPELPLRNTLNRLKHNNSGLNAMLYLEGKHFLPDHNLNYTDKMGMAAGVEIRVPLIDPDVVSLAVGLPEKFKQSKRHQKLVFKKAMEGILPHEIIYRPKTGFGVPFRYWFRNKMEPYIEQWLSFDQLKHRGIFDPDKIQRFLALNQSGKIDISHTLFAIMCLEGWCQIFLDKEVPSVSSQLA